MRLDRRQLLRDGRPVALKGKAFDLLAAFLESGGRVLTRDELYARLWGERIVEEANLSQTIYVLRRALDPDGDGRGFIETVPRIGYRFAQSAEAEAAPLPPRNWGYVIGAVALLAVILSVAALGPWGAHRSAVSSAAFNADALGEYHLALRTPTNLSYALEYFEQAERAAPRDASGFAGAAAAYALLAEFQEPGSARQRELVSSAIATSSVALRLDAASSRALAVRGFIAFRFRDDRLTAERDLEHALAIDPHDAQAHLWRGVLLMRAGRLAAATSEFQAAHQLAPTSEVYSRWLARAYAFQGESEQAIALARETLRLRPDDAPAMLTIAQAQEERGDFRPAIETLEELVRKDPYERPFVVPDIARLELRLGKGDPSLVEHRVGALAAAGNADPFETALLDLTLGDRTAGMRMLRRTDRSTFAIQRYDPRLLALL